MFFIFDLKNTRVAFFNLVFHKTLFHLFSYPEFFFFILGNEIENELNEYKTKEKN